MDNFSSLGAFSFVIRSGVVVPGVTTGVAWGPGGSLWALVACGLGGHGGGAATRATYLLQVPGTDAINDTIPVTVEAAPTGKQLSSGYAVTLTLHTLHTLHTPHLSLTPHPFPTQVLVYPICGNAVHNESLFPTRLHLPCVAEVVAAPVSAAAALDSAPVIPLGAVPIAPSAPPTTAASTPAPSTVHTTPVLPQYHPVALAAMLRAGKYQRVQRILGHIANCVSYVLHWHAMATCCSSRTASMCACAA